MTQGAKIDIVTYVDTSGYKLTTYPVSIIDPSTCILARLSVWEIIVLFISCFLKVVKSDFFFKVSPYYNNNQYTKGVLHYRG